MNANIANTANTANTATTPFNIKGVKSFSVATPAEIEAAEKKHRDLLATVASEVFTAATAATAATENTENPANTFKGGYIFFKSTAKAITPILIPAKCNKPTAAAAIRFAVKLALAHRYEAAIANSSKAVQDIGRKLADSKTRSILSADCAIYIDNRGKVVDGATVVLDTVKNFAAVAKLGAKGVATFEAATAAGLDFNAPAIVKLINDLLEVNEVAAVFARNMQAHRAALIQKLETAELATPQIAPKLAV